MKIDANELAKVEQMLKMYNEQNGEVEFVREAINCYSCSGGCNNFCTSGCRGRCDGNNSFCWNSR